MLAVLLYTGISGVIGTAIGGLIGLSLGNKSKNNFSLLLSFSAGMMLSILCFDLIPESLAHSSIWITVPSVFAGLFFVWIFDQILHHHSSSSHDDNNDLHHHDLILKHHSSSNMLIVGLLMIGSVALHNLPEGLAIGSVYYHAPLVALMMSILLALHNLPEGMGIALALVMGGLSRTKAILLTALSGISTVIGGFIGYLMGGFNDQFTAIALGIAAGSMLYVIYFEILPQVRQMDATKKPIVASMIGLLLGFVMINLFHA